MTHAAQGRTSFVDNLRVALTALVVFHHAAITYGAGGGWYLHEAPENTSLVLTLFCTVNQAFFMGFFFLIAGSFTPGSYDRKGAWRFLADRLRRLGIPLLVFGFGLDSLTVAMAHGHDVRQTLLIWGRLMARGHFSSGPLWFAQALLVFSVGYAAWRLVRPKPPLVGSRFPGHGTLLLAALLTGLGAGAIRLVYPVGTTVLNLQFGYFASYVVLFAAGAIGARGHWLEHVPPHLAHVWLLVSALALATLLASPSITQGGTYAGGWSAKAIIYALFEPFFAWGVILTLLRLFQRHLNTQTRWSTFLAEHAYTVYIIHPLALVGIARALSFSTAPAVVKFALTGLLGCALSLLLATLILRLPGAWRIL